MIQICFGSGIDTPGSLNVNERDSDPQIMEIYANLCKLSSEK